MPEGTVDAALQTPAERHKGLIALLAVVCIWVSSAEVMQFLFEGTGKYDRPVLVTMMCVCSFALYGTVVFSDKQRLTKFRDVEIYKYGGISAAFCMIWIIANLSFNSSLEHTSAASATALAASSTIFSLVGGFMIGVETMTMQKTCAVMMCFAGCLLTTHNDMRVSRGTTSMLGDGEALLSAILYAGYLLLFQKMVGDKIDTPNFLTLVGAWGFVLFPVVGLLEEWQMPNMFQFVLLFANAVIGTCISERLWLYGALRCGPTAASVALVLTIPLAATVDLIRGRLEMKGMEWFAGASMIILGFAVISKE